MTAGRYNRDFFVRTYSDWIGDHPEHVPGAIRLRAALDAAAELRARKSQQYNIEIPETLFISPTSTCNRRCSFCLAGELVTGPATRLSREALESVISQCRALGVRRFSLIGGEPLMAEGIDDFIADNPDCFFSVFTNGLLLDQARIGRFRSLANCILMVHVSATDPRGALEILGRLRQAGLLFGYSATTHSQNHEIFGDARTLEQLADSGSRLGILFDYLDDFRTPAKSLVLAPHLRRKVVEQARAVADSRGMLMMCVPEDEDVTGGCGAAGRMTLHLSAHGTIDPCPLVPYSKFHIDRHTLLDALKSEYFIELRRRSRDWERDACSCAYRHASREFHAVNHSHGAVFNRMVPKETA